jgi:CRISPR-associated protein Csd1
MILAKLCELARREELLKNPDYEPKAVAWIIAVSDSGKFLDIVPTASSEAPGKKPRAKVFQVPRRLGRTSSAVADFLVDKSEYVLGVEPDGKRSPENLRRRLDLFRQSVREAREATGSPALVAVEAFLGNDDERRRVVERISPAGYASNDLFAFQYRGQLVHELPDVQAYFSRSRRPTAEGGAQCLVCGNNGALAEKHPPVKIPGGTTSGIALVSFNSDAFESYGLSRNENAPVCRDCADAYTTGLIRLLSDRYPNGRHPGETLPRRFVRLSSDTTAVYWADEETPILDLLTDYFDAPRVETVEELLLAPRKGRMPPSVSSRFYCLILSGGQGRAVLRGMHTGTVGQVEQSMRAYFESIRIGSDPPRALRRLLESIVLQGKLENLPPSLLTDVFAGIVFGGDFPRTLLARAVGRCQAEQKVTRERAALLRAYLIRNSKLEVNVGLDKENTSVGYRLGRLMAVLERVQGAAQNNPNKTIVDRYYGAASTRPATVFPRLMALAMHHLAKLTAGLEGYYQKNLGEVMDGIAGFPQTLSLEEQGLFALGYYHQRFFKKTGSDLGNEGEAGSENGEAA